MLDQLIADTKQDFEEQYGTAPQWVVAAPGRVNLIGEHTDYNDGFVFPMAIDRYTVIAAGPAPEGSDPETATISSSEADAPCTVRVESPISPADTVTWDQYVQGVVAGCVEAGLKPGPFQAAIRSNVPLGGGLSSSAALEVAIATLIETITGQQIGDIPKVFLCQKAEHEYAKMPCGIMDQFASVMAQKDHLMRLDCRSQEAEMIPLTDPDVAVLIINSNVKHELTGSEYPERRAQCEAVSKVLGIPALRDATMEMLEAAKDKMDDVHFRRARHVITEDDRTGIAADALKASDWSAVGEAMYASHYSLKDDYEVSCPELDVLVKLAQEIGEPGGVIGSRMTGGGFGGCTVSLVRADKVEQVTRAIEIGYEARTGVAPTIFSTRPAQGAMVF